MRHEQFAEVLGQLRLACDWWNIDDFSKAVYQEHYPLVETGRQKYLKEKFHLFQQEPVVLFFTLDEEHAKRFAEAVMRCHGPGLEAG